MTGRRLRVSARSEPRPGEDCHHWTLFARLGSEIARALHHEAARSHSHGNVQPSTQGWAISPKGSPVEFLPLAITLGDGQFIYVSFNGGSIRSEDEDAIELPASLLSNSETHVEVNALSFVEDAISLEVEPLSLEDWELLEVHSEFLENGGLLRQVSVVYTNQILALYVGNQDLVHVRVLSPCGETCQRLVADTEILIRPKPRVDTGECWISPALRVSPTWTDLTPPMQAIARAEGMEAVIAPPGTILVHPDTWMECRLESASLVRIWKVKHRSVDNTRPGGVEIAVARVEVSTKVAKDHTVLDPLLRYQLGVTPLFHYVRIQLLESFEVDSFYADQLIQSGALGFSLEPLECSGPQIDDSAPWLYPDCSDCRHQEIQHSLSPASKRYSLDHALGSLLDLPDICRSLPVKSGSLIALPWPVDTVTTSEQTLYRVIAQWQHSIESGASESTSCVVPQVPIIHLEDLQSLLKSSIRFHGELSQHRETLVVPEKSHLLNLLPSHMNASATFEKLQADLVRDLECYDGIVICGEVGSGKTHAALAVAAINRLRRQQATLYMDCRMLQSSSDIRMKETLDALTDLFQNAIDANSCLVILDNLDALIPNIHAGPGDQGSSAHQHEPNPIAVDQVKLIANHLQNLISESTSAVSKHTNSACGNISIVITCRDEDSIALPMTSSRAFFRAVRVASLDASERDDLLTRMLRSTMNLTSSQGVSLTVSELGDKTEGFRPRDLDILAKRASHLLFTRCLDDQQKTLQSAIEESLNNFIPVSRQGISVEDTSASATWAKLGGLFQVKKQLTSTILHPVKYRRIYKDAPIRLPRGILLFGPPGCGKSYLIPGLAKECGFTLITCRGPELLDKYIGASEAKVRQLFQRAYSAAPSILFLDEFDALAPRRGSDHTGVTDRVVNQLLTFLDGVEVESGNQVYIVAATSRPDKVDPALLRPGRLEQHIFVGFPDGKEEWCDVLDKILAERDVDTDVRRVVLNGQLWDQVHEIFPSMLFSPADMTAAVHTAHLEAVQDYLGKHENDPRNEVTITITRKHILKALQLTRPSLSHEDGTMLTQIYAPFLSSHPTNEDEKLQALLSRKTLMTALH